MTHPIVLAISGASGAVYGVRLAQLLARATDELHLVVSSAGRKVLELELGLTVDDDLESTAGLVHAPLPWWGESPAGELATVHAHHEHDMAASIASGSFLTSAMVICPCSGGTLSSVVNGASRNLIHRAADVHLKEGRPLVVVPRETPLSRIQLDNMLRLRDAGATILPASPGWYHGIKGPADLVDFVVARILDQLGVDQSIMQRWPGSSDV